MAPRETENNAYAKFWGDKQRALWYVMVCLEWSIRYHCCDDQSHTTPRKRWTGTRDRVVNNQIWLPGGGHGIRTSSLMCMPQKSRKKQNLFQL